MKFFWELVENWQFLCFCLLPQCLLHCTNRRPQIICSGVSMWHAEVATTKYAQPKCQLKWKWKWKFYCHCLWLMLPLMRARFSPLFQLFQLFQLFSSTLPNGITFSAAFSAALRLSTFSFHFSCNHKTATAFVIFVPKWHVIVFVVVCLLRSSTFGQIAVCSLPSWSSNTNCHTLQLPVCRAACAA